MPGKSANVKNEKQYEKLKEKGMSKERAAKIANSPGASSRGGKASGSSSSSSSSQGGTTAQKKAAGRKGGKATARKNSYAGQPPGVGRHVPGMPGLLPPTVVGALPPPARIDHRRKP